MNTKLGEDSDTLAPYWTMCFIGYVSAYVANLVSIKIHLIDNRIASLEYL